MNGIQTILSLYLALINIVGFSLMGIDKKRARRKQWRIKERTLFLTAIFGGSIGAIAGMYMFSHKTKHASFYFGMPGIALLQLILILLLSLGMA